MSGELKKELMNVVSPYPHVENGDASDVVVRSKDDVYVVIAEEDANKVSKKEAGAATMLAKGIGAKPLIVAERIGSEDAMDEVVYERYGLPVVNLETFAQILEGNKIYIRKKKSVYVVSINAERLRKAREENNISLGALAEYLGVSRKSVYEYEKGRKNVNVDVAIKLAELFGDDILEPVDFSAFKGVEMNVAPHTELEAEVLETTDSVHVPKGKVSVGGRVENMKFSVLVPHGKDNELEWFAELSKIVERLTVAIGFNDVPRELEDSRVEVVRDLEQFLGLVRAGEHCERERGIRPADAR